MSFVELFSFLEFLFVQTFGLFIAFAAAAVLLYLLLRQIHGRLVTVALIGLFIGVSIVFYVPQAFSHGITYPFVLKTYGPADGPVLPLSNALGFFKQIGKYERVENIARDPRDIPPSITRTEPAHVKIDITAQEVISQMAPGVYVNYWTFGGKIPGPFLRVREGDTVELTLHNPATNMHHHSIDLHAVTGPGGGAASTIVAPGESKTFAFKALHPGLFVYHCAHPNVANHMAHGMYGLILVEPEGGMTPVDKEFYVMQGEFYTAGGMGQGGLQVIDGGKMLDSNPNYVVFNGKTAAVTAETMQAQTGEKVRIYFGNGGVNLISSFHVIGEVFDTVYPEGALGEQLHHVQTTTVPAGGAVAVEFGLEVPGNYVLVDHALARMDKGAWGVMKVIGENNPEIFSGEVVSGHGH